jgi:hypothetical protein
VKDILNKKKGAIDWIIRKTWKEQQDLPPPQQTT